MIKKKQTKKEILKDTARIMGIPSRNLTQSSRLKKRQDLN